MFTEEEAASNPLSHAVNNAVDFNRMLFDQASPLKLALAAGHHSLYECWPAETLHDCCPAAPALRLL
jgi:hypothetical protein